VKKQYQPIFENFSNRDGLINETSQNLIPILQYLAWLYDTQ